MNHLELFSGTHSFGKVSKKYDYRSVSLDRDIGGTCPLKSGYKSDKHYKEDIMTWDYKQYPVGHFKLITASPVCLWWSALRACWVGRKLKAHGNTIITHEILQQDIDNFGKPMVDKVIEIIEYFKPKHYIIENPRGSKMKHYIAEKYPKYNEKYNDFSYCKFSDWGYQKDTRFWTNISGLENCLCKKDCGNMITIKTQDGAKHTGYGTPIKSATRTLHKSPIGDAKKAVNKSSKLHKINMGSWGKSGTEQSGIGCGNNRLERYRIPELLIDYMLKHI